MLLTISINVFEISSSCHVIVDYGHIAIANFIMISTIARKINISTGQQPPFSTGRLTGTIWPVLKWTAGTKQFTAKK